MTVIKQEALIQKDVFDNLVKSAALGTAGLKAMSEEAQKLLTIQLEMAKTQKTNASGARELAKLDKENADAMKRKIDVDKQLIKLDQDQVRLLKLEEDLKQKKLRTDKLVNKQTNKQTSLYAAQSKVLNDLRNKYKNVALAQGASSRAAKALLKQITPLDKKLKQLDKTVGQNFRSVGNYTNAIQGLKGVFGKLGIFLGIRELITFGKELNELAQEAKGVKFAFDKLGQSGVKAFAGIKKSTRGLISDLDIQKSIVKFDNFNISLEETDTLMEFLSVRSTQTGDSIKYLQDSLVEGLSKESKLRIDNLGISAAQLNTELEKTPNFVEAVANIARRELKTAGSILDDAANSSAKWNASLQNAKLSLSNVVNSGFVNFIRDAATATLDLLFPTEKLSDAYAEEQLQLNILINKITDVNIKEGERLILINDLIDKYPKFLSEIDAETVSNDELVSSIDRINQAYIKRIALQSQEELIRDAAEKAGAAQLKQARAQVAIDRELARINRDVLGGGADLTNKTFQERVVLVQKALEVEANYYNSKKTGQQVANNLEAKTLDQLQKKIIDNNFALTGLRDATAEVTKEQGLLNEVEIALGATLEELNEMFKIDTGGGGSGGGGGGGDEPAITTRFYDAAKAIDTAKFSLEEFMTYLNRNFIKNNVTIDGDDILFAANDFEDMTDRFGAVAETIIPEITEAAKISKEQINEIFDATNKALQATEEILQRNQQRKLDLIDEQKRKQDDLINDSIKAEDRIRGEAQKRGLNATESIDRERDARKRAEEEKLRLDKERLEVLRKMATYTLIIQGLSTAQAISQLEGADSKIEGYYKGTETTLGEARGRTGSKDGHIIRADDNEAIFNPNQTKSLGIGKGGNTTQDIVDMYKGGILGSQAKGALLNGTMLEGVRLEDGRSFDRLASKVDKLISNTDPMNAPKNDTGFNTLTGVLEYKYSSANKRSTKSYKLRK